MNKTAKMICVIWTLMISGSGLLVINRALQHPNIIISLIILLIGILLFISGIWFYFLSREK